MQLAVEASKENDIIRIDGNGPFKSPHLIINHNLSIQAGLGYEPVLVYESGHNKKGIRYSPFKDVDARNMMQVKKGKLTIEGLRMEMDPPNVGGANISWSTIRVNGGDLQLLNCRISEGNRKGMAAILFEKPGAVLVKNSALIGGRAAIEVVGNGKQEIQIENSLLFSNAGIHFVNQSDNNKPEITVTMKQMTLQCLSAFTMNGFDGSVDFISNHSLFKAEDFGSTLLKTGFKKTGRSWSGEGNIYDTSKWLGTDGKVNPSVQSADSWSQFWDEKDINPKKKSIQFSRQNSIGRYSHTIRSKNWNLKEYSSMAGLSPRRGIDVKIVGTGVDFHRFRDSFLYKKWAKSRQENSSTEDK